MIMQHAKLWQPTNGKTHTTTVDLLNDRGQVIMGLIRIETAIEQITRQLKVVDFMKDEARNLMHVYAMIRNGKMTDHHSSDYEFYLNKSLALQTAIEWIENGTMRIIKQV